MDRDLADIVVDRLSLVVVSWLERPAAANGDCVRLPVRIGDSIRGDRMRLEARAGDCTVVGLATSDDCLCTMLGGACKDAALCAELSTGPDGLCALATGVLRLAALCDSAGLGMRGPVIGLPCPTIGPRFAREALAGLPKAAGPTLRRVFVGLTSI